MSKRKSNLMRALVEGILAGLAVMMLSSLHAVAETPHAKPTAAAASHMSLLPFEQGLQDRLVLLNPPAPGVGTSVVAPVVVLPQRAPLAAAVAAAVPATPAPWSAELNPARLWQAMSAAPALLNAPSAYARTAARPQPAPGADDAATVRAPRIMPAISEPESLGTPVDLRLETHHSLLLKSPVPLKRVSITDDTVASAIVVSPTQVLIQGRTPGEVSLLLWDADANARAYTVQVGLDPAPLQRELDHLYPNNRLQVSTSGDAVVLSGVLPNAATAKQALAVAGGFTKNVVNNLSVDQAGDPAQVLLQVRFAEVDRSAVSNLGVNILSTSKMTGAISTGQFGPVASVQAPVTSGTVNGSSAVTGSTSTTNPLPNAFGLNNLLNVFLFRRDANVGATIEALEQHNLLQILAEPNLVAMDGKEASFLAGGEFPFPVVQGQGAVNNVTIQFKPFGVNLHFKPTILPDGTIDLQVAPEVSALDFSNALTVSGFLIPALSTRRAETELELSDGQSFVIAGLLDNRVTNNLQKIPGISDIPVLGKLFQSRSLNKSRNELMVVVTAHLVHPSATAPKIPVMPKPFLLPSHFDGNGGH